MRSALLALLLAACLCSAEETCPFLKDATAAGILGGEVVSHSDASSCLFTFKSSQLVIKVQTVTLPYKPNCRPNPTSIRGIGNEAVACSNAGSASVQKIEQVSGRVRNRAFLIELLSNDIPRDVLREKIRSVAEQVSGILF